MTRRLSALALALTLALTLALPAAAQQPPEKVLATMKPGDGFQVELFAHEPMLINPTSMDVDPKGRVWVAEAVNYRRKNFGRPILRPEGDRIQVLIDKDGDGKADEAVTFYQGPELYGPLGICVAPMASRASNGTGSGYRVFVCQSPDILVFEDKDGDLKADGPPTKFLTGFGGFDHDHGVHGINIGPDGKLYFTVGDAGVKGLQSSDGKGKKWTSNSTDCRAGTVWRCDMDGTNLELIAHNFRNNYEACVNSFGEVWLSDNDDDGNQQTRICFVMPGGNYGYHPRGKGESHWHEEQPGIVHKALRTGFGSPTGITFYEGTLFPEKYRGQLIHADAGPREVRCFHLKPKGAGYELDKEVILTSTDNWFRPSAVRVGPDGSIFVADWYDPGVGGHGMGDWTRGRVYRLTPKGHKGYAVPDVKLDTREGITAAFKSPNLATRAAALAKVRSMPLVQANAAVFAAMLTAKENGPGFSMRVSKQVRRPLDFGTVTKELGIKPEAYDAAIEKLIVEFSSSQAFRAAEARNILAIAAADTAESKADPKQLAVNTLESYVGQEEEQKWNSPAVYREALLALQAFDPNPKVIALFYRLAKKYDGKDIFYRAALNIACGTDPERRDAILADFDKHFPEWNDTVADLVWELRPKSVLPRLNKLLADAKLTGPQKARIVDILAASDDPSTGQAVLGLLLSDAGPEVKAQAIEHLRQFLPGKWKTLQARERLGDAVDRLLKADATRVTGLQLVAASGNPEFVEAVKPLAADGSADVRAEAIRTLGKLRHKDAVAALAALAKSPGDTGVKAIAALGEQAAGQAKDPTVPPALAALQDVVLTGTDPAARQAALEALAGTRAGTVWLLDQQAAKKLPAELVPAAGILLRNSPFQGERNKAMVLFPAPGKLDIKKLPSPAELAKRPGSADRGKKVWEASLTGAAQCAKCHTVRGVGGQVGPDLSMIGKKASRENLFESILLPSKAIADQYVQHQVKTAAGLTVTGLLVGETPQAVTLRDANGKDTTIPKADLEGEPVKLKVSIMPEDVVAAMTEAELVDLVSYLQTLQTAALTPEVFQLAGPFDSPGGNAGLDREYGPGKGAFDPAAKFQTKVGEAGWRPVRPDAKGYFDLAAFHGTAGVNSVSYLYAEVDSPADQDAEVLLGADDGVVLTVNGTAVFTDKSTEAATPGRHTVPVKLKKGVNTLLVKIANGNHPHGLYLTLLSGQEVKAVRR